MWFAGQMHACSTVPIAGRGRAICSPARRCTRSACRSEPRDKDARAREHRRLRRVVGLTGEKLRPRRARRRRAADERALRRASQRRRDARATPSSIAGEPVTLGADETGAPCATAATGRRSPIAVADPFGSLTKKGGGPIDLRKVRDGIVPKPERRASPAPASGLVHDLLRTQNQLIFSGLAGAADRGDGGAPRRPEQSRGAGATGAAVHFYVASTRRRVRGVGDGADRPNASLPDGTLHVTIAGRIDERFDARDGAFRGAHAPRWSCHLGGAAINLVARRARLRGTSCMRCRPTSCSLHVSPAIASQLTMIPNLCGTRTTVESAKLPFTCPACGAEKTHSVPFRAGANVEHAPKCSCGSAMELDGLPEQYLPM